MVEAAKKAYKEYPTVVNAVSESKSTYDNNLEDYAKMDSLMQSAQKAIGGSSDSAQLAQSYMWTKIANGEIDEEYEILYHDVVILAVLAQLAIDGCKKIFEINVNDEIKRIRSQKCMDKEKDFPKFMRYTHKIPITKNGKDRPYEEIKKDKDRVVKRIDNDIICPMNWLIECLEKIQGAGSPTGIDIKTLMVEKPKPKATDMQMRKIRKIIEDYDAFTIGYMYNDESFPTEYSESLLKNKSEEVYEKISNMKISLSTMYRLIESCMGYNGRTNIDKVYKNATKYATKTLNVLHHSNRERFLSCFIPRNVEHFIY